MHRYKSLTFLASPLSLSPPPSDKKMSASPTTTTAAMQVLPVTPMFTSNRIGPLTVDERGGAAPAPPKCLFVPCTSPSCRSFCKLWLSNLNYAKKVVAEFIGTFILIFSAAATPIVNDKYGGAATLLGAAASAGLAVTVVILSIGHISGAHLNPSVTVAFAVFHQLPWADVPGYVAGQVLGSVAASFALKGIFQPFHSGGVTVPSIGAGQAFFLEFIVTFALMFVIAGVATDTRAVKEMTGIAVGATVLMNILVAGKSTGASMNPVRTLGPAIATGNYKQIWIYMTAPILGAVCGAGAYHFVKL